MKKNTQKYNEEELYDDYDDSIWRLIMLKYAEVEGERLLKEAEEARNNPEYAPSEEAKKRIAKLIERKFRRDRIRAMAKIGSKFMLRFAIVIGVISLGFILTFTTVSAFRVQVLNFLLGFEEKYIAIKLDDGENTNAEINLNWHDAYIPSYIPEGYRINEIANDDDIKTIDYINNDKHHIRFMVFKSLAISNVDNENSEVFKYIEINGTEGIFVIKNGITTISWQHDDKIFVITAQLSEKEIVKIAENIIYIK